jgi:hypothetical protein
VRLHEPNGTVRKQRSAVLPNDAVRRESGLAALDVQELLRAEISPEPGHGDHYVGACQRRARGDDAGAAMRDVGEGAAMDEGWRAFQRLHEVGIQRVAQKHRHRVIGRQIGRRHRRAVSPVADDHSAEARLQVRQIARQAQRRHHLGGDRDVESVLARIPGHHAAQPDDELAQGTVIPV